MNSFVHNVDVLPLVDAYRPGMFWYKVSPLFETNALTFPFVFL